MGEPTDGDLLRSLRGGDRAAREAAFAELHRRHSRRSFQLAWRVLRDVDLAADAVQEAFLSVWKKAGRFEERAQFSSWLFRVVLNRSIDLRRREQRVGRERGAGGVSGAGSAGAPGAGGAAGAAARTADGPALPAPLQPGPVRARGGPAASPRGAGSSGDDSPDPLAAIASRDPGPEAAARSAERDEELHRAIHRLSPKLREVVQLRYAGGLSYEEIGALLGVPPGTVRSRLNRAHAALRSRLGPDLEESVPELS